MFGRFLFSTKPFSYLILVLKRLYDLVKFGEKYQERAIVLILVAEERVPAAIMDIVAMVIIMLIMVIALKMQSTLFRHLAIDV